MSVIGVSLHATWLKNLQGAMDQHPEVRLVVYAGIAIGIAIITVLVARIAAGWVRGQSSGRGLPPNAAVLLGRTLQAGLWIIGLLAILTLFGVGLSPLAAFIGVIGLAASLSLQTVLQNLIAGIYLLAERPFHIGDTIVFAGDGGSYRQGVVENIEMRVTHIRDRANELVLVPNLYLFSHIITNTTAAGGHIAQATVTVPTTDDPDSVRQKLASALPQGSEIEPKLTVSKVEGDRWTGTLYYWVPSLADESAALWKISREIPDATVETLGAIP
ncbi:MAG TPA: mechanosensitive ion channel domain-containing protein [Chloroflexota bacterium]|nr:mechanosensitive ion channel domain-containing protein [Chloroflexota bacterium]